MTQQTSFRDIEKLSAYLDNQLSRADLARVEAKLAVEPRLQEILLELRQARALLKHTPRQRVPHNFTLTPKMVGMRPPLPRSVPIFRLASITAAVMLFLSFAFNFLAPIAAAPSLASEPQRLQSGGGCGYDNLADCGDVAMEASAYGIGGGLQETTTPGEVTAMSIASMVPGTTTPEPTPEASLRTLEQPTQAANITPTELPSPETPPSEKAQTQPVLNSLQMGLILLVLVFGGTALLIRQINILRWQKRQ
jgi:hypothetical protein